MYQVERLDSIEDDLDGWDSYLRIEVGRYTGDIDLIRELKRQSIESLVNLFDGWRKLSTSFEEDLQAEYADSGKSYMDFYIEYMNRIARSDYKAVFDSPIVSMVVQTMMTVISDAVPMDQRFRKCAEFLVSDHFKSTPYQWLRAHIFATLKAMVKKGAYINHERAQWRLSGLFYDVNHIATYSPYVDAFVMDQAMAELVTKQTVALEQTYGVKVFSLNNWDDFLDWLDDTKLKGMTEDHKRGLAAAYPWMNT